MEHCGSVVHPKHFVQPCLLLLLLERPDYGYDLVARLRALGVDDDSAAVYRVLRAMERDGAVISRWKEPVAGPARRVYEITPLGREVLDAWAAGLDEGRRALEGFLARYDRHRRAGAPGRVVPDGSAARERAAQ